MKTYIGKRLESGDCVIAVQFQGLEWPLHHVKLHSPEGFEWGYAGSGPADTALSILADYFDERPGRKRLENGQCKCWRLHQKFKEKFKATALRQGFVIQESDIKQWLESLPAPILAKILEDL
jgi:hypothetical protein